MSWTSQLSKMTRTAFTAFCTHTWLLCEHADTPSQRRKCIGLFAKAIKTLKTATPQLFDFKGYNHKRVV